MNRYNVTCAVCFDVVASGRGDIRPTRHGFAIVTRGWGHGHQGAWHTGPCFGALYAHLGISCDGTKEALNRVRVKIEKTKAWLLTLATRPVLSWIQEPTRTAARAGRGPIMHEVEPGRGPDYNVGRPSYDSLHEQATRKAQQELRALQVAKAKYKEVIEQWSAEKYPAVDRVAAPAVMHLRRTWKRSQTPVPLCKAFAMRCPSASASQLTDDEALVTCGLCRKQLDSRDQDRTKAAKRAAMEATSAAKEAATPRRFFAAALWNGLWTVVWVEGTGEGMRAGRVLARVPCHYESRHDAVNALVHYGCRLQKVRDPRKTRHLTKWLDVESDQLRYANEAVLP